MPRLALICILAVCLIPGRSPRAADGPEVPRIDSVAMAAPQPQASDEAVIWCDDFDGPEKAYTESEGRLDEAQAFGGQGRSLLSWYEKGSRGTGNRKVFFGDSPTGKVVRKGQSFDDIYWRVYVKHQHGWTGGGPAKLSRATSIVASNWSQAMIAHVWSSGDPTCSRPPNGSKSVWATAALSAHWQANRDWTPVGPIASVFGKAVTPVRCPSGARGIRP